MLNLIAPDLQSREVFVCGPSPYLAAVREAGVRERIEVRSFDPRVLRAVRAADPTLLLAALVPRGEADLVAVARAAGATRVSPHHTMVDDAQVRRIHEAGLTVIPWTANTPDDWRRLIDAGVDGIVTDDPAGLRKFLGTAVRPDRR